jgi:L-rhamnose isomerase
VFIGKEQNDSCIHNLWIPDGSKKLPIDRFSNRTLLKEFLDEIFIIEYRKSETKDDLESKLFGIGNEVFVIGSRKFCLGYALA